MFTAMEYELTTSLATNLDEDNHWLLPKINVVSTNHCHEELPFLETEPCSLLVQ